MSIECECGAVIKASSLKQHIKTNKHLKGAGLIDSVKSFFSVRNGYNNMAQKTLKIYGNMKIFKMFIYRKPVVPLIEKFLNVISFGKYEQTKSELSYDKMFHLGCFIMVGNELGQFYNIIVEKNEVLHIEKANFNLNGEKDVISIVINPNERITIMEMLNNCQDQMQDRFFKYNPWNNNCQIFIKSLLEANNLYTQTLNNFVYQPIELLIKNLPQSTQTIAKSVTNLGGWFNKMIGGGLSKEAINKAEQDYKNKRIQQQNDPRFDEYYDKQDKGRKIAQARPKGNSEYMNLTEPQKQRYIRGLKGRQQEYTEYTNDRIQKENEELDRIERQKEKDSDPFSFMTDLTEQAISNIPVVGKYISAPISALRTKLEGLGLKRK